MATINTTDENFDTQVLKSEKMTFMPLPWENTTKTKLLADFYSVLPKRSGRGG